MNIILATDSYKLSHWNQYPEGTETIYSYFESRVGARFPNTVFFGLQYLIKRYLEGVVVTPSMLDDAERLAKVHFGKEGMINRLGWEHIIHVHDGKLPLRIKAVAEGTAVPTSNVLMTVENTDPACFWLTNAMETLLTHVWYGCTVASLSYDTLQRIGEFLDATGGSRDGLLFMLHDFGGRGVTGHEAAGVGGAAHLVNALGTDTLPGMELALNYYDADLDTLAFSVPATEHSVMTALGREGEMKVVDKLLDEYPDGILSVVADSYDIYGFVQEIGTIFHQRILARDGKFVVRPDSITKEDQSPEELMVTLSEMLWDYFGGTINDAGYKVLEPHIGLLWGDGINPTGIETILTFCKEAGFAAENYVFGMGGGLLQKIDRDTQSFAFKCCAAKRNGKWYDIQKDPLDSSKVSKKGRLQLEHNKNGWFTTPLTGEGKVDTEANLLKTVFEDGELIKEYTFSEVRANAKK